MEFVHTVLILMLAKVGATRSFLSKVTESLIKMRRPCEFLELKLYSTCDLCPQRTVRIHCAYLVIPRKSSVLIPHGALPSTWLQRSQNIWVPRDLLLTMCSSSFNFFLSLFKEDIMWVYFVYRKYMDFRTLYCFDSPKRKLYFQKIRAKWITVITTVVFLVQSYRFYTDLRLKKKLQFPTLVMHSSHKINLKKKLPSKIFSFIWQWRTYGNTNG